MNNRINLDFKIIQTGIYHYQTEDMVIVEINIDEMKQEFSNPFYTESGWHKVNDIEILSRATDTFKRISQYVNDYANKQHNIFPHYLCGSEELIREFYILFNNGCSYLFDIISTYYNMTIKNIDCGRSLFLCNNEKYINKINENCYGYYYLSNDRLKFLNKKYDKPDIDNDVIKGKRLTNLESMSLLVEEDIGLSQVELNEILEPYIKWK